MSAMEEKLRLRPALRGFWTDDELLQAANEISVALLKKLQLANLVHPEYAPSSRGMGRRVWRLFEVARVQLALKIANDTGIGIQAVAALLGRIGSSWVDSAANYIQRN